MKEFDLIIIGAGPAGLMAAVYASRYLLKTLVIGELSGGTISQAHEVCNFPAFDTINGLELSERMIDQVKKLNVEIFMETVENIHKNSKQFVVETSENEYRGKKLILAMGVKRKHLGLENEDNFLGKGVSYCSACDGLFYKDKVVGVVGGSDAALTAAIHLSDIAKKVYIIYRRDKFFRAEPMWIKLVERNKKIEVLFNSEICGLFGKDELEKVLLKDDQEIVINGLFVEIGAGPDIEFLKKLGIKIDLNGYIMTDINMNTSIPGIFAAGDIVSGNFKQAVIACSQGAIAANSVYNEIKSEET